VDPAFIFQSGLPAWSEKKEVTPGMIAARGRGWARKERGAVSRTGASSLGWRKKAIFGEGGRPVMKGQREGERERSFPRKKDVRTYP